MTRRTTALDPSLTLEQIAPGTDYHAVYLHGVRIGDVRGTEAGTPGLAEHIGYDHKTRTDAANAVLRRYLTRPVPASCRWCRTEETTYLLIQNHGGEHGVHWGHCMSQALTRNHVTHDVRRLPDSHASLLRSIARATELWGHRDDTDWIDDARAALARHDRAAAPPEHARVLVAAEDGALW